MIMAGVRVTGLPNKAEEKHIKIHFSKPQNGGGAIKKIYYPLFNNDAVVFFQDSRVVDTLLQNEYAKYLGGGRYPISIHRLPEHTVFSSMQARIDPDASVLLQASPSLLDEFKYNEEIDVTFDEGFGTYILSGNWYQLEWAWTYLDTFIQQQEIIQDEIKHQPFRNNASPLDVEDGGGGDIVAAVNIASHAGSNFDKLAVREITKSDNSMEPVASDRSKTSSGRITVAQSLSESSTKHDERRKRDEELPDLTNKQAQIRSDSRYRHQQSPSSSENEDDDTRMDLTGKGYHIPEDSIPMSLNPEGIGRKSDQERTFDHFSALDPEATKNVHQSDRLYRQLKDDSTETLDRQHALVSNRSGTDALSKQQSAEKAKTAKRAPDASPDRQENSYHSRPDKGYQSLPYSRRETQSSYKRESFSRSGAVGSSSESGRYLFGQTYTKDQLQYQFKLGDVDVVILYGDLVQETTDAIINPANSGLEHWGGASYAIAKAAGQSLSDECKDHIAKNGQLKVSEVMHTTGGNLHAFQVLHTCGPMWVDSSRKEKTEYDLTCTFLNCFNYAEKLWLQSLSVPAISTGVFGVPLDICVRSFLDALLLFDRDRATKNLRNIRFINKDQDATVTAIVLLQTALEGDLNTMSSQAIEKFNRYKTKEFSLPKGRQERKEYGSETASKTSLTSSLYRGMPVGMRSNEGSKESPRRSNSLDLSKHISNYPKKVDTTTTTQRMSAVQITGISSDRTGHIDNVSVGNKSEKTDTGKDYLSDLSKHREPTGASPKYKDIMTRTTPSFKPSLLSLSGTTANSVKIPKNPLGTDSPTGKVRARRVLADDEYETDDMIISGKPGTSSRPVSQGHRDDDVGYQSLPVNLANVRGASGTLKSNDDEKCAICLNICEKPKSLKCSHTFCSRCIDEYFKKYKPSCPICGSIYGKVRGTQPRDGEMVHTVKHNVLLPGYEKADGTIVIKYTFPSGKQKEYHPNPGRLYKGIQRTAYLPNNNDGRLVLGLLKKAFEARLVFTIGESRTTGKEGVLTWNDIHHKTSVEGGPEKFGYPDPSYLTRVKQELADKGITSMY